MFGADGTQLQDFVADPKVDGWDIVLAVVVLIASWIGSNIAKKAVIKLAARLNGISPTVATTGARIVKYFIFFVGIGVTLSILGAPIQPLLAAAIIAAVVMFLTLRGLAEDFGASVILQTRRPFVVGDEVELMGYVGMVKSLNGHSVVIETFDGRTVHLPNRELLEHPIVNNSVSGARRTDVEVRVASAPGAGDVIGSIRDSLTTVGGVLATPAPLVGMQSVESDRLTVLVQFWHSPTNGVGSTAAVVETLSRVLAADGSAVTVISPPPIAPRTPPARI